MKNHMFSKSLLAAAAAVALGAMAAGANADTITGFQTVGTPATVNLTTQGTVDWIHYISGGTDGTLASKNVTSPAISNLTISNQNTFNGSYPTSFSWTDGTSTSKSGTDTGAAQANNAVATSGRLSFTVTPDGQPETLAVYLGFETGKSPAVSGTFTDTYKLASVSTPVTLTGTYTSGGFKPVSWVDTINFQAASTDTLTVTIDTTASFGNTLFSAATLADTPQAPEPASLAMLGVGAVGLLLTRRRKVFA